MCGSYAGESLNQHPVLGLPIWLRSSIGFLQDSTEAGRAWNLTLSTVLMSYKLGLKYIEMNDAEDIDGAIIEIDGKPAIAVLNKAKPKLIHIEWSGSYKNYLPSRRSSSVGAIKS